MSTPQNLAAWLTKAGSPLEVKPAPLPVPGPGEIVVKNSAIAINPVDCHMADIGIFVQEFPTILGNDVAGEVYAVGHDVKVFKKGDRVIG
jgi:NADPH:quinone reductase-like Zn-dependent oxidoreductase